MSTKLPDGKTMRDGQIFSARLNNVVTTEREFDELVAKSLPELLDRATGQTKRYKYSGDVGGIKDFTKLVDRIDDGDSK